MSALSRLTPQRKHGLAIIPAHLSGKPFNEAETPEDVAAKREKLAEKAEKAGRGS